MTLGSGLAFAMPFGGMQQDEEPKAEPMWEALSATLRELGAEYHYGLAEVESVPFKRGDLVNVRQGCGPEQITGRPSVVLEVRDVRDIELVMPPAGHGVRLDIRLVTFATDHDFVTFWTECWMVMPYVPVPEVPASTVTVMSEA